MALTDNLVSYWKMDEASGNARADSHGSNTLSDNSTVNSTTGKINNAAQFNNGVAWLSKTSNASLQPGDNSFTFQAWVNLTDKTNDRIILGKSSGGAEEYLMEYDAGTDRFRFWVYNTDYRIAVANNLGSPSTATWYHIIGWYDAAADTVNIKVNDGTTDSTGSITPGPTGGAQDFRVGAYDNGTDSIKMNGLIDEVGYWSRVLTGGEITSLYNGGSGLAYGSFGGSAVGPLTQGGKLVHGILHGRLLP